MGIRINSLDTTGKWKVETTPIYTPSVNIKIEHTNQVSQDSGRNDNGVMMITWQRRDIRKVNLKYSVMTASELGYMLNLLQGNEFKFTYPDINMSTGAESIQEIDAYCGESKYNMLSQNYLGSGEAVYTDVEINVIEK